MQSTSPVLHTSVRTSTSINDDGVGGRVLTVRTTRLEIRRAEPLVLVNFTMQSVSTAVLDRQAANDGRGNWPARGGRRRSA